MERRIASYFKGPDPRLLNGFAGEALTQFRDWLLSQPAPEASELVKEARAEIADNCFNSTTFRKLVDALAAAESRCERYKEALEWYADKEHYKDAPGYEDVAYVEIEGGKRARSALQDTGEK